MERKKFENKIPAKTRPINLSLSFGSANKISRSPTVIAIIFFLFIWFVYSMFCPFVFFAVVLIFLRFECRKIELADFLLLFFFYLL